MRKGKSKLLVTLIGLISLLCLAFAGCVSPTALNIEIASPQDGATVNESLVTVTGTVSGYPRGEAVTEGQTVRVIPEVTVNGVRATVDEDGGFLAEIELNNGENTIEAIALFNNVVASDSIVVTCNAEPELSVEITSPVDGAEIDENMVTVNGTVSDIEADVTVNGLEAEVDENGIFSVEIELTEGENVLVALAVLGELEVEDSIVVVCTVPAPVLSVEITSPEDGIELTESPVMVTGTVSDTEAVVTVNGYEAEIAEDGSFSVEVELVEGENIIEAAASLGEQGASASITATFSPLPATGTVELRVTGSGAETVVTGVKVTASKVEVHRAGDNGQNGEWITLDIDSPAFDLVELRDGGLEEILASGDIEPGKYTQVRVTVEQLEVSIGENILPIAEVPSNELKFVQPFEIVEGETSLLTLDFDVAKTVSLQVTVKPVAKIYTGPQVPGELEIQITSPEDGIVLTENLVTVSGTVSDVGADVTVNGQEVEVDENGDFSIDMELDEGENTFTALAVLGELEVEDSIVVVYTMPAPVLSVEITSPENGIELSESPVVVTGTVSDTGAVVTVNGYEAEVAEDGTFSVEVELTEGENTIEAIAMLDELEANDSVVVTYVPVIPALSIEITSPEDGAELAESLVTVSGVVSDAEAAVTVNEQTAEVAGDGTFSAEIELVEGENVITAVAALDELTAEDSITVNCTLPLPALSVEIISPEDGAEVAENLVTVTGTVSDVGAIVTVNGDEVEVDENGSFSVEIELVEGENLIEAVATLDEQENSVSITVNYSVIE